MVKAMSFLEDSESMTEASWSYLTSELEDETQDPRMALYFPSLPVRTVRGSTVDRHGCNGLSKILR
jgi:hypothetical protein